MKASAVPALCTGRAGCTCTQQGATARALPWPWLPPFRDPLPPLPQLRPLRLPVCTARAPGLVLDGFQVVCAFVCVCVWLTPCVQRSLSLLQLSLPAGQPTAGTAVPLECTCTPRRPWPPPPVVPSPVVPLPVVPSPVVPSPVVPSPVVPLPPHSVSSRSWHPLPQLHILPPHAAPTDTAGEEAKGGAQSLFPSDASDQGLPRPYALALATEEMCGGYMSFPYVRVNSTVDGTARTGAAHTESGLVLQYTCGVCVAGTRHSCSMGGQVGGGHDDGCGKVERVALHWRSAAMACCRALHPCAFCTYAARRDSCVARGVGWHCLPVVVCMVNTQLTGVVCCPILERCRLLKHPPRG
jgi:hypothetical protein